MFWPIPQLRRTLSKTIKSSKPPKPPARAPSHRRTNSSKEAKMERATFEMLRGRKERPGSDFIRAEDYEKISQSARVRIDSFLSEHGVCDYERAKKGESAGEGAERERRGSERRKSKFFEDFSVSET